MQNFATGVKNPVDTTGFIHNEIIHVIKSLYHSIPNRIENPSKNNSDIIDENFYLNTQN